MLRTIQQFFDRQLSAFERPDADREAAEHGLELATAALLVEMTRADASSDAAERRAVLDAVRRAFRLDPHETEELVALAEETVEDATCLYQFTRRLNDELSAEARRHVIELLWRVAFADGRLDKYEEHLVRKVADLLYVPHSEFMKARHRVEAEH